MKLINYHFGKINYLISNVSILKDYILTHMVISIGIFLWIITPFLMVYSLFNYYVFIFNIFCYLCTFKIGNFPIYFKYYKPFAKYNLIFKSFNTIYEETIDINSTKYVLLSSTWYFFYFITKCSF